MTMHGNVLFFVVEFMPPGSFMWLVAACDTHEEAQRALLEADGNFVEIVDRDQYLETAYREIEHH